jgi:ketosteroid isomerase-like protein
MPHPNAETLRQIDESQLKGDIEGFLGHFTDDVKVHIGGASKLTGDYQGKEQFQDVFGRYLELVGEVAFDGNRYFADNEHGVDVQAAHYSKNGQKLDLEEAYLVRFRDGKVAELWYYPRTRQPWTPG